MGKLLALSVSGLPSVIAIAVGPAKILPANLDELKILFFSFLFLPKTESYYVAQDGLELTFFLLPVPIAGISRHATLPGCRVCFLVWVFPVAESSP